MTYYYYTEDEGIEDAVKFQSPWNDDRPDNLAADAAAHLHRETGGDDHFPMEITVLTAEKNLIGTFYVAKRFTSQTACLCSPCIPSWQGRHTTSKSSKWSSSLPRFLYVR
jgi:hypothetical protein